MERHQGGGIHRHPIIADHFLGYCLAYPSSPEAQGRESIWLVALRCVGVGYVDVVRLFSASGPLSKRLAPIK